MSSSLCGTVFSESKAMDKSTNLLTFPSLQQTMLLNANSTVTIHKFHIYTESAIRYASTEFRMHYKLGVLSFTYDVILKV